MTGAGVEVWSFQDLLRDYRLALRWHLAATIGWLANAEPRELVGRERQMVERLIGEPR